MMTHAVYCDSVLKSRVGWARFGLAPPSFRSAQFSLRISLVTRPVFRIAEINFYRTNERLVSETKCDDAEVKRLLAVV